MCLPNKIKRHFLGFFADMLALLDYLKVPIRQKLPQQPICRFVGFQMVSWSIQNCLLGKNTSTSQQAEFRLSVGILALVFKSQKCLPGKICLKLRLSTGNF